MVLYIGLALILAYFGYSYFRYKNLLKDKEYIREQIELLDKAIKDEDCQTAFKSFCFLAASFKTPFNKYYNLIFTTDRYSTIAINVNWEALIDKFLEILRKYKERTSLDRTMPLKDVEDMIERFTSKIEKSYEFNCLECGATILHNENKCPKCGWEWQGK